MSPLDFLITTYRNEAEPINVRVSAAQTVCQFIYPRLTSVDLNAHNDQPTVVQIVRFSDMPLAEQGQHADRPVIDVTPEGAVTGAIAVAQDDGEAEEAAA